jgi:hypothetical protein
VEGATDPECAAGLLLLASCWRIFSAADDNHAALSGVVCADARGGGGYFGWPEGSYVFRGPALLFVRWALRWDAFLFRPLQFS